MIKLRSNRMLQIAVLLVMGAQITIGCSKAEKAPQAPAASNGKPSDQAAASELPKPTGPAASNGKYTEGEPQPPAPPEGTKAAKAKRPPIYEEKANGKELIAAAIERAKANNKRVLIEWGGNWCGWCHKLHDVFHDDPLVQPIVYENFELVLIDEGPNHELMEEYGGKDTRFAYPHLTILDVDGSVLTNQETGSLEVGPKHDPEKVAGFLKKWMPPQKDAEAELGAALKRATEENKRVLMHVGTPYCGWCVELNKFLHEHEALFSRDYIDLKIDTLRMTNGDEVAKRLHPAGDGGIPWTVILDKDGTVIADSFPQGGNIGYPYQPEEIDHFMVMLKATKQHMSDADLESIRSALNAYREKREAEKAARTAGKTKTLSRLE